MGFSAGARLGAYEILAPLGAGGMGEVWQARDTRLGREVAIKVLPDVFAQDPEWLVRFRREAQLLASLYHPNIAAIHGLEEAEGKPFLALELVRGEDLTAPLSRGPIPVAEAIGIARQIVDALEEAHAKGIVHRDLKPGNVKLTPEGKVKVLDFGLAKAYADDRTASTSATDVSQSPTLARPGTLAGAILGTAPYMSPEQASGKALDGRTDIWSFGVVLFEMLTGRPLFMGDTTSEVLASVIKDEGGRGRADLGRPWWPTQVAPRRQGALLPGRGWARDGGGGQGDRVHVRGRPSRGPFRDGHLPAGLRRLRALRRRPALPRQGAHGKAQRADPRGAQLAFAPPFAKAIEDRERGSAARRAPHRSS